MADFYTNGETGLMGIAVDPEFEANRTFYTCQGEEGADPNAQVVAWTVNADYTDVDRVGGADGDVIDLAPWLQQDGRHGGCRIRFGPESPNRHLWISAGDTACGTYPQNTSALAGKVLRVDEDTGLGVAGTPFFGGAAADDPVYTYGHRNPQGLALRPGTNQMWSVEHGPGIDDEVNLLQAGGNYGWNPVGGGGTCQGYNEAVPMTDLAEFPNAIPAAWDTNGPTIATSGGTFLDGDSWGGWDGGFIVAALAGQEARVLFFTDSGVFIEERQVDELTGVGRLRGPAMGIDGDEALYLTSDQRIFRIEATP
jgi:glucose/arabinose dehydrogenase